MRRRIGLYSTATISDYAARVGVPALTAERWVGQGMPTVRDWHTRPMTLAVHVKRADRWLRDRGITVLSHTQPVVYFIHDVTANRIKVGFTENIDRRYREIVSELATLGHDACLLGVVPGDRTLERWWLADARDCECYVGGEWCWPDPEWAAELSVFLGEDRKRRAAA